ncbi:MAG: hypothetical protein OEU52_18150, partial [Xanthomonadales bacterium]|nr:hypothetical protein [Xanthomonadales bacterium]
MISILVSLAISILVAFLFLSTKLISPVRVMAYCAFLFCGLVEAHLQWLIYSDAHGDQILEQFWITFIHVAPISIFGILSSIRYLSQDSLLLLLVGMTLLLGVLTAG